MHEQTSSVSEVPGYRRYWIDEEFEVPVDRTATFRLLSDFRRWPSWAPGIKRFARKGTEPLKVGDSFLFVVKLKGIPFKLAMPCRFYRIDESCIEWGLGLLGNEVRHRFELRDTGRGTTRVRHVEYASNLMAVVGFPVASIALRFNQALSRAVQRAAAAA